MNLFKGRTLLIVTQHGKESVIAPQLTKAFGVKCVLSTGFDTDTLGTFSGEIERKHDALLTAREKCKQAMLIYNCDLAVSSEGSFGAHPTLFFAPADEEIVMLLDTKNNLEVVTKELSLDTNFNGAAITTEKHFNDFLETVRFPSHGIIIKKAADDHSGMVKGITDTDMAFQVFTRFINEYGAAYVETDMRAHYNPTRMTVIEKATVKLIEKLASKCPACETPGFGITHSVPGLPCSLCSCATKSTLYHIYTCQKCHFNENRFFPRGVTVEDPMFCDRCNP